MENDNIGWVLTETKRDYITGDLVPNSDSHKGNLEKWHSDKVKGVMTDLQTWFHHLNQETLERPNAFAEGHDREDGSVSSAHDEDPIGFAQSDVLETHVDKEGKPRDPDSDINPNTTPQFEHIINRAKGENKASPETQEALIDAVGLLCRAAEAGQLDVPDLIEQGMERYYADKSERINRKSEWVVKVNAEEQDTLRTKIRLKDGSDNYEPIERKFLDSQ